MLHLKTFHMRSIGWALFGVNFRPLQEIEAIIGGGQIFDTGSFFARLRYYHFDVEIHTWFLVAITKCTMVGGVVRDHDLVVKLKITKQKFMLAKISCYMVLYIGSSIAIRS